MFQRFYYHGITKPDGISQQLKMGEAVDWLNQQLHACFVHGFTHRDETWEEGICTYGPAQRIHPVRITSIETNFMVDRDHMLSRLDFELRFTVHFVPL